MGQSIHMRSDNRQLVHLQSVLWQSAADVVRQTMRAQGVSYGDPHTR